jgi:hypothetical protein
MMQTTYLDAVLTRLSTAGLHLKKSKCVCMVSQVIYCGYRISDSEIEPVIEKVEAIQNAPAPQNVSQLRSFLGMLNEYTIVFYLIWLQHWNPCTSCFVKRLPAWQWTQEQHQALSARTKELLQSADLLVHFDPSKPLILATDASDYGVGAVLSHQLPDGSEY